MMRTILLIAALAAGTSYAFADLDGPGLAHLIWKGSGVGLLALWAAVGARSADGWLLAIAFAIYAAADMAIEFGMVPGAATFLLGHSVMIALFLRHRRTLGREDWMIAALMLIAVPIAAFLLPERPADAAQVAIYAAVLGAMATGALVSTFRRDRVYLGAMLFVVSDMLIFARLGVLRDSPIPDLGIWPLYFAGQALMVAGTVQGLRERTR